MHDILIIGAGVAGLTAAIYARRAGLEVTLIERNIYGGQMVESAEIGNYPGIPSTTGPELSAAVYEQAAALGAQVEFDTITACEKKDGCWLLTGQAKTYEARAIIAAGGATHRKLGCEGEERLAHKGVSYCATCDGAFFRGKRVAVVGGGNTALEDALFLSNMCERVYVIHRRNEFRGDRVLSEAVLARENIETVLDAQVERITGESRADGVDVVFRSGEKRHIELSGVFVAVGVVPDNELLSGLVELDEAGYIRADETGHTGTDGIFAAGDCRTKQLRQIVTAAADGANAAFSAANYLNSLE